MMNCVKMLSTIFTSSIAEGVLSTKIIIAENGRGAGWSIHGMELLVVLIMGERY